VILDEFLETSKRAKIHQEKTLWC